MAWNQFNWLQELQSRERNRIEFSMVTSAQGLSKRLQEEILFLPSLLRIRQQDTAEIEAIFTARFRFWQYYTLFPSMVTHIFLLDGSDKNLSELKPTGFVTSADTALLADIKASIAENKFTDNRTEDTGTEIRMLIPVFGTKENRNMVLCIFDKQVLFHDVIPAIAEKSLESTDIYVYRIIDTRNGNLIYTSVENYSGEIFANPDIEMPVFEQIRLPSFRQPPDFLTGSLPETNFDSFSFIKERTNINPSNPGSENKSQSFPFLVLQIVNKDGSLATLSSKATVQNAFISFGAVILLALVMIVLVEATRRSRALALRQKEFIATITHELKTPLSVISSAAQNLADGLIKDQKKVEQYGSMIKKESSRLGISIEHFLLYSNTASLNRLSPVLCDVGELIQTALKFTEEERVRHEFRTEVVLPEEPVFIRGDRIALESVFQNLVQNVIKHAVDGKYLGIIVSLEENTGKHQLRQIIIKIRDKGPGISAGEQKLLFEPFTRGKRAVEGQIPGNGIGLNLVRRIVTVHTGTVMVESKIGNGCTFIIKLPAVKGE